MSEEKSSWLDRFAGRLELIVVVGAAIAWAVGAWNWSKEFDQRQAEFNQQFNQRQVEFNQRQVEFNKEHDRKMKEYELALAKFLTDQEKD